MNEQTYNSYSLSTGTVLHDIYQIDTVLGEGGFGIIYTCLNISTGETVAIKEYFPDGQAKRVNQSGDFCVQPLRGSRTEFEKGYRHFLEEAEILRGCQELEGIVTVYDFFEENNTAYIVMEYIEGTTLEKYIRTNGTLSYEETLLLMEPVICSLSQLHQKGLLHRDISPDNLILGLDNRLHLIDFGAAREKNIHRKDWQTIILKKGYAPPEQYLTSGNPGEWVDVYALSATMYFMIAGIPPIDAIERMKQDCLPSLTDYADIPPHGAAAIERGLALHQSERFRNMESLYLALTDSDYNEKNQTIMTSLKRHKSIWSMAAICIFFVAVVISLWFRDSYKKSDDTPVVKKTETTPSTLPVATQMAVTHDNDTAVPELLTMIDVSGYTVKKAKESIHKLDASIVIKTKKKYSNKVKSGRVISQSIAEGTVFNSASIPEITLTVSKGFKVSATKTSTPQASTPTPISKPLHTEGSDFDIKTKPPKDSFFID